MRSRFTRRSTTEDPLFRTEPFCGILGETSIGSSDPVEFIRTATSFSSPGC
jgi:aldehyde dehydrogenase (NAD(P)+)